MANTVITRVIADTSGFSRNMKSAKKDVGEFSSSLSKLGALGDKALNPLIGMTGFAGVAAAVATLTAAVGDSMSKIIEFEDKLSHMSSLTGAIGKDLEYFKNAAIQMGSTSTLTATQVVEAFQNIGSKMPQLLSVKEALASVTGSAITLAEAANIDMSEASNALANSLNQMGVGAEFASEYINILAAGSQKGAADIKYLNAAVEKSGSAASQSGLSFTELVSAIEAIAPKITDASQAGTNLRNIFLSLEKQTDDKLKPSVVGFNTALENLSKKGLSAKDMMGLFGKENYNAASALIKAKEECFNLQAAITGTTTAEDQAKTNTDNLKGALLGLSSAWEGFVLHLDNSKGTIKGIVDDLASFVRLVDSIMLSSDEKRELARSSAKDKEIAGVNSELAALENKGYSRKRSINVTLANERGIYDRAEAELKAIPNYNNWLAYAQAQKDKGRDITPRAAKTEYEKLAKQADRLRATRAGAGGAIDYLKNALNTENEKKQTEVLAETTASSSKTSKKAKTSKSDGFAGVKIDESLYTSGTMADFTPKSIDDYSARLKVLRDQMNASENDTERQGIAAQIRDTEKALDSLNDYGSLNPIKVDIKDNISKPIEEAKMSVEDSLSAIGSSFSQLGNAIGGSGGDFLAWAGNVAQSIATAIPAITALTATQTAQGNAALKSAAANAANSVAMTPFVGAVLAVSAIAGVIAAFAAVPSFAGGGIVGGQNYGDGINANISSGEMIINQADQKKLFDQIKSGGNGGNGIGRSYISGEQIITVVNNYGKRTGRGKLI